MKGGRLAPKVIITLPAFHAESTLARTVDEIPTDVADELILVDDASTDNTAELARSLDGITVFVHPENRGYGGNQKTCYSRALEHGADVVVLLHPDYQYDPKAVPLLVAPILGGYADMTFGSRFAGMSDPRGGSMPRYRYWGNRLTTTMENLLLGSRFTEMHSGLRAYTRDMLLSVPFLKYTDDFSFDSQILCDAISSGFRVVEVPIPTRYTKESSSISILRSLKYVGESIGLAASVRMRRGRRGRRSPLAHVMEPQAPLPRRAEGSVVQQRCVLCDNDSMMLLYPSNATEELLPNEFACTSDALAKHDDILRCPRCEMVSSRPTISPEEIVRHYAEMVDEEYLREQEGRRQLFEWVLDRIDGYPVGGRTLLELGSNVGLFLQRAEKRGWRAQGLEPSHWAVTVGRQNFGMDLRQGTLEDVDLPAHTVDVAVMLDVLEHVVNPVEELSNLRELMTNDGLLVLSTVNVASIHARARADSWPWFIRPHLHYFTPRTLKATLQSAGFRMVGWSLVPRWFHLSYVAERARENLGAAGVLAEKVSKLVDPRLPVGWLGDVVMVEARTQVRNSSR
jgi:2-polyprenyl-3-methyl-5-hydroxy-6-metoxy-1,4-benzoquinol methylase